MKKRLLLIFFIIFLTTSTLAKGYHNINPNNRHIDFNNIFRFFNYFTERFNTLHSDNKFNFLNKDFIKKKCKHKSEPPSPTPPPDPGGGPS